MSGDLYITRSGYNKLMEELEAAKTTKRREIARRVGEARAQGDISENSEYDAAKEAQAHNEKRIADLEDKLSRAKILDYEKMASDEVLIGATVLLRDVDRGEEFSYTLVCAEEADYDQGKISVASPIGSGLLNHKEGETVDITVPAGKLRYTIVKITRE